MLFSNIGFRNSIPTTDLGYFPQKSNNNFLEVKNANEKYIQREPNGNFNNIQIGLKSLTSLINKVRTSKKVLSSLDKNSTITFF